MTDLGSTPLPADDVGLLEGLLTTRAIRRIASFVAASLVATLAERNKLDADTQAELNRAVRERINAAPVEPETDEQQRLARKGARPCGLLPAIAPCCVTRHILVPSP